MFFANVDAIIVKLLELRSVLAKYAGSYYIKSFGFLSAVLFECVKEKGRIERKITAGRHYQCEMSSFIIFDFCERLNIERCYALLRLLLHFDSRPFHEFL